MKILPRRSASVPETIDDLPEEPELDSAAVTQAKGRPTPKRRDSTVVRGPVTAPKTRKEAYARQKQQSQAQKQARRATSSGAPVTAAQRREALRAGDPSMLPRRDQGQTKKLARDYVDTHRMFSNYLLLLFPLMIASYALPNLSLIVVVIFFALIAEWNITGRRIRKMAAERFGKAEGTAMGIGFYAGSRAYLPRRWRLPAPQVERGDPI